MGKSNCGNVSPSSCVAYTGKNLLIMGNEKLSCDADINEVFHEIDESVFILMTGLDLTGLNPQGLVFDPKTVTQAQLDQVLINQVQAVASQVESVQEQITNLNIGSEPITIILGPLAPPVSACESPANTYPLIAVLNVMLAEILALKTAVGI